MDAIGIDIGGTFVKAGRLSPDREVLLETSWPTPGSRSPSVLVEQVRDLVASWNGDASLGVACAGIIDSSGVVVRSPNLPAWQNVPLKQLMETELGCPSAVLNDANAFTLAESESGAAKGYSTVVGLAIGTGVGGGLVLAGHLWEGNHGFAAEIGHMILAADGPQCACGSRGCLEALIGTRAILDRYGSEESGSSNSDRLTPAAIAERARGGEARALKCLAETGRLLGLGLVSLTHLLDPERFVIGGGIAGAGDLLIEPARVALARGVLIPADQIPSVVPASLGNSAGWIGAALAGRRSVEGARP